MKVAIVQGVHNDIIYVTKKKKAAKAWINKVRKYQDDLRDSGDFDDHWWRFVEVDELTIKVWEVDE